LILEEVFSAANQIIGYINAAGISFSRGATIFYSAHKIQYRYHIYLGAKSSRVNSVARLIKSKLNQPLNIGEVLAISGFALPDHSSLDDYFSRDKKTGVSIDIPSILANFNSEEIIIQFEKWMSPIQLQSLVPLPHVFKRPVYIDQERMETPVEVVIDYANLWYKKFEWFRIVDIRKRYNVEFQEGNLSELLPLSLKSLINAIEEDKRNSHVARQKLRIISRIFRKFKDDSSMQQRLSECVSTDKPGNVEFTGIHGDLKRISIQTIPLELPYTVKIHTTITLDSKDLAVSAKIIIDLQKLYSVVRDLSDEVDRVIKAQDFNV
jgi:hypothetical protein